MAHHKRRRPRTRGVGKSDWKTLDRKLRARGEAYYVTGECPGWWNALFHIRPTRREERRCERAILRGADADEVVWPRHRRPHVWYW